MAADSGYMNLNADRESHTVPAHRIEPHIAYCLAWVHHGCTKSWLQSLKVEFINAKPERGRRDANQQRSWRSTRWRHASWVQLVLASLSLRARIPCVQVGLTRMRSLWASIQRQSLAFSDGSSFFRSWQFSSLLCQQKFLTNYYWTP